MVTGTPWVLEYVLEIRLTRPANKLEKQKRITLQPSGLSNYIRKTGGRLIRKYMKVLAKFEMPLKMSTIKGWKDGSTGKHTCCQV